jgi:hypothetical protein
VASIGYDELVAAEDDPLPIVKANDLELPVQVFVKYSNLNDNYQDGSEASDRLISSGQNTAQAELPLSFTPQEAKRIADGQLMDAAASALRFGPFGLTRDYAHSSRPTSSRSKTPPATSSAPGSRRRASPVASSPSRRFRQRRARSPASRRRAPRATATAPVSRCRSTPRRCCSTSRSWPTRTTTRASTWWGIRKAARAGQGACCMKSVDGTTYAAAASLDAGTVIGTATTILGAGVANVFDEASAVTVDVGDGELASYTRDAILSGTAPGYLVGNELLFARTATLVSLACTRSAACCVGGAAPNGR